MSARQYLALSIAILLLAACSPITTAEPAAPATATQVPTVTVTPQPTVSPTNQPTTQPTSAPATPTTTAQPIVQPTLLSTPTPQSTPSPTQTTVPPTARPTPIPTARPTQAATPLTCISYKDAAQFVGQMACVTGSISSTAQSGSTYFINFSASRTSFYAVSFNLNQTTLPLAKGQCVKLNGKIETFNDRTQMVIRDAGQVASC